MDQIIMWCCLQGMQDAYVTITLVDGKGNVMGRPQDTPTSNNLAGNYVLFNCEVSSPPPLAPRLGNSPLLHAVFSYAATSMAQLLHLHCCTDKFTDNIACSSMAAVLAKLRFASSLICLAGTYATEH